ncbi:MAG TPA: hypothetical protein VFA84_14935 [Acidimicrobiales bacterium]|nr:hypothetical protein [Acidimicrobiales bacterium]
MNAPPDGAPLAVVDEPDVPEVVGLAAAVVLELLLLLLLEHATPVRATSAIAVAFVQALMSASFLSRA